MLETVQGGKRSFGRDVLLQTVKGKRIVRENVMLQTVERGKESFGRDVMLQTVQGGNWSVGRDVMLHTVQGGNWSFGERRDVTDRARGKGVGG